MTDQSGPTSPEGTAPNGAYEQVLVCVSDPKTAEEAVLLAACLTGPSSVLHIMNVTAELPFHRRAAAWRRSSKLVMELSQLANRLDRVAKPLAATAHSIPEAIINAALGIGADLVIMGWHGEVTPIAVRRSSVVRRVLSLTECDNVVLKYRNSLADVKRIVVPIHPKFHRKRIQFVRSLDLNNGAPVVLLHVITPGSELNEDQARQLLQEPAAYLEAPVELMVVHASDVVDGILGAATEQDLIIAGPGREWVFNRFLFGHNADHLANDAPCSVVMFKAKERKLTAWFFGLLKAVGDRLSPTQAL